MFLDIEHFLSLSLFFFFFWFYLQALEYGFHKDGNFCLFYALMHPQ